MMIQKTKQIRLKGKALADLVKEVFERDRHCCVVCKPFVMPVRDDAVERWKNVWADKGVGWVTEDYGKAKTPGYTLIASYPGSSTFDTAEMARLIDYIVSECKDYGIETRPQAEIDSLLKEWRADSGT